MKPHLGFIVMALVWSVPLAWYAIWYVRRTERQARRRLQIAVDQINTDTRRSTVAHVSRERLANASDGGPRPLIWGRSAETPHAAQ